MPGRLQPEGLRRGGPRDGRRVARRGARARAEGRASSAGSRRAPRSRPRGRSPRRRRRGRSSSRCSRTPASGTFRPYCSRGSRRTVTPFRPDRPRKLLAAERATEALSRHGRTRVALGFPNSYEIGMSNLGFQWVYRLFNREEDVACDRFFVEDDGDLRGPRTLETDTPLGDFPLVAFSISWEMDYVNFLRLLPAARIPLERTERGEGDPIVLVGRRLRAHQPGAARALGRRLRDGRRREDRPGDRGVLRRDLSRDATLAALADVKGLYVPGRPRRARRRRRGREDRRPAVQGRQRGASASRRTRRS